MSKNANKEMMGIKGLRGFALIFPAQEDIKSKRKEITLKDLVFYPVSWKIKNLDKVTGGKLNLIYENDSLREFRIILDYNKRVGNRIVNTSIKIDAFQSRKGYIVAIDCPSFLIYTVASLISLCIYGNINGFYARKFEKEDFLKIWDYAIKLGGIPREIHLRRIKGNKVSIYHVTGQDILGVEEIGNPVKLMRMARKIKRLGFSFPPGCLDESPFHFWVADWGGGTIYEPLQLLPHHALILAEFFKRALEQP